MVEAFTRRLTSLVRVLELLNSQTPQLGAIHYHLSALTSLSQPLHHYQSEVDFYR